MYMYICIYIYIYVKISYIHISPARAVWTSRGFCLPTYIYVNRYKYLNVMYIYIYIYLSLGDESFVEVPPKAGNALQEVCVCERACECV